MDEVPAFPLSRIVKTWWPLAASWLLMGLEGPAISAIVARLADPAIHLAAYGGIVFPLSLLIESPIIMLLAASTALSKDWASYRRLRGFMLALSLSLTLLHVTVAFTPLYYVIAERLIHAPAEIVEPARLGLMVMLPWTWSIAYRRFNQGVLIRFGHSLAVGLGTLIRLLADGLVLAIGYLLDSTGIIVASGATIAGVLSEALYVGLVVRPVLREQVRSAPPVEPVLSFRALLKFYIPLSLTPLLTFLSRPIGSAALSRMPGSLESLAVWPVITGLVFLLRSIGLSYNEVVIALLDETRSSPKLRFFTGLLTLLTTSLLLLMAATPLAGFWFERAMGLAPPLAALAQEGLWFALILPGLSVLQSWYQGSILYGRRTRGITEAVGIFLLVSSAILWAGVAWGGVRGLFIGLAALSGGELLRTLWLWRCSRGIRQAIQERDALSVPDQPL